MKLLSSTSTCLYLFHLLG